MNIKLLLIIFFISTLSLTDDSLASGECPAQEPIYGKALKNYTFKTLPVSSPFGCLYYCHYEVRCQSYNYVINDKICEMNNRTKEANPWRFVSDSTRFYMKRGVHRGKLSLLFNGNRGPDPDFPSRPPCILHQTKVRRRGAETFHWHEEKQVELSRASPH